MKHSQEGFTFLEVIIALAVLGSALTIILGLQSALVQRTVLERQQREAALLAREILSAIEARESAGEPMDVGVYNGTPADILNGVLPVESTESEAPSETYIADYEAELTVEYWGIPNVNDNAMKRIELLISWGERKPESLQLVLFIPFDEDEVTEEQNEEEE
ncbi:MAG: type IV pilus modification PilV family protein [Bdellovibrionota bacterium]|jgi:prepilin-type N-terminal cleavage/methylation domain-containing protein